MFWFSVIVKHVTSEKLGTGLISSPLGDQILAHYGLDFFFKAKH